MRLSLLFLVGCLAFCSAGFFDDEPDSEEHGTFVGKRGTSCRCGWANKDAGRIVGGEVARVNEYPFIVLIAIKVGPGYAPFCGGSIISKYFVLTAAHCTYDYNGPQYTLIIIVGEHDFTKTYETEHTEAYGVTTIYQHEKYNNRTISDDISLLYIKGGIKFNDFVGPVCLPMQPINLVGQWVLVAGWGHIQFKGQTSPVLRKVYLRVIDLATQCIPYYRFNGLSSKQFCTYNINKDSCQGDSGGPVVWLDPETNRYTQAGLVSFGKECAGPAPGVNTDIYSQMAWILRIMSMIPGSRPCSKI